MMNNKLKYPNFLIIGAGKAGTTSIIRYLDQHPDVFIAKVKDSEFFAMEGKKPVAKENDPESLHYHPSALYDLKSYQKLFDGVTNEKAVGEASTIYLYDREAYKVIKKYVPDVKMIAIFRDPVERLYSRWMHLVRDQQKPSSSFSDALDRQSIWWRRNDLIWEGFYFTHLNKFYDLFDKSQILIKFYDELMADSVTFTRDIFRFLDVDPNFTPDTTAKYNVSGIARSKIMNNLIGGNSIVRKLLKNHMPGSLEWMRKQNTLQGIVSQLRSKNLKTLPLDPEIRKRLIEEVYKEDILKLQHLLNRDLSNWLK